MSSKHPIISVVGSSGAGTTFVKKSFEKIFSKKNLKPVIIEGDSFHKYQRSDMKKEVKKSIKKGKILTHFSEHANYFDKLYQLFDEYSRNGTGKKRYYIHSNDEAKKHNKHFDLKLIEGQFTPWEDIDPNSDLMFYEGLHGGVITDSVDVASRVDLLVGVVPSINIEWIQKIQRDTTERPYTPEQVTNTILDRMPDYVKYITPQFDKTHINFHRIPLIDTSNPFRAQEIPSPNDSLIVTTVRINSINLENVRKTLPKQAQAFLQNNNTLVFNGNYMIDVMDNILSPIIDTLIANK